MTNAERNKASLEYSEISALLLELRLKNPSVMDTDEYKELAGKANKLWRKANGLEGSGDFSTYTTGSKEPEGILDGKQEQD